MVNWRDNVELRNIIAISIMVLINITVFLGLIYALFPIEPDIYSGLISFLGSIIGGIITFIGVKMTLEFTTNEKFIEQAGKRIFMLEDCIRDIHSSNTALTLIQGVTNFDEKKTKEAYNRVINHFSTNLNKHYSNLRVELDYDFIGKLTFHVDTLNAIVYRINENLYNGDYSDAKEKISDIYTELLNHKQKQIEDYYRINRRHNKFL
jgi:hypothetical protein